MYVVAGHDCSGYCRIGGGAVSVASLARDRKPVKLGAAALDSIAAPLNVDMIMRSDSIVGDTVFFHG